MAKVRSHITIWWEAITWVDGNLLVIDWCHSGRSLMTCLMVEAGKKWGQVSLDADQRSSCPLPLWSSLSVSLIKKKPPTMFVFTCISSCRKRKAGCSPRATGGSRNRSLRLSRKSAQKENIRWRKLRQLQENRTVISLSSATVRKCGDSAELTESSRSN